MKVTVEIDPTIEGEWEEAMRTMRNLRPKGVSADDGFYNGRGRSISELLFGTVTPQVRKVLEKIQRDVEADGCVAIDVCGDNVTIKR